MAVTDVKVTATTSDATTYATTAFTPANNDLLVVFVISTATVEAGSVTDSLGGTYTKITSFTKNSGADTGYVFVANQLATASSRTITFVTTPTAASGAVINVLAVSGMTLLGSAAVRGKGTVSNQAAGTPAVTLDGGAALTSNPVLVFMANATTPAGVVEPTGFESASKDTGFTSATVTWGGSSASAFGAVAIELNRSAGSSGFTNTVAPTVTGTFTVGSTVTANAGTWSPTPSSFNYFWHRADDTVGTNLQEISGATGATYTLAAADSSKYIQAGVIPL